MTRIRQAAVIAGALILTITQTGCMQNMRIGSQQVVTGNQAAVSTSTVSGEAAASTVENAPKTESAASAGTSSNAETTPAAQTVSNAETISAAAAAAGTAASPAAEEVTSETISWNPGWEYAAFSKINSGTATLYHAKPTGARGKVVCINAGHGTKGGGDVKTQCHPDGTPKVTGGTTEAGATEAVAVSSGTTMKDGTPEAVVTLKLALVVKDKLLNAGFDVLMIRESEDVQLDNIARTVIANNNADCHIALHYDSTDWDKGVFYFSVPGNESYRSMEPVASHWKEHNALGDAVMTGMQAVGLKLFEGGSMEMDLTQTSYSTVPSIDLEVGDTASDYSDASLNVLADGLVLGLDKFFS